MPHRRSKQKLEERLAKRYVYKNSKTVHRCNDPNEVRERIYTGTANDVTAHVLSRIRELEVELQKDVRREGVIPDLPQGLVISDGRGEGFFDVQL